MGEELQYNPVLDRIIKIAPLLSIKIINLMKGREEEGREGTDIKCFGK